CSPRRRNTRQSGTCRTVATQRYNLAGDLIFGDEAEETVLFIEDSGSEINAGTAGSKIEREKIPQAINLKRSRIGFADRLNKSAGCWIVIIDGSVTKIANPEFTLHQSESPGRVEIAI